MEIIRNPYRGYAWRCEQDKRQQYRLKVWTPEGKQLHDKRLREEPRLDVLTGWLMAFVKFHRFLKGV